MHMKHKQQDLIKTSAHQVVTMNNVLGDLVKNYDVTASNQRIRKANEERNAKVYAKNKDVNGELFDEDPRIMQLPEEHRWSVYRNPTPYQKELNEMKFKINRIIQERDSKKTIIGSAEINKSFMEKIK